MPTLGEIKSQIADELSRTDLGPQIGIAINDAIDRYSATRFYWNESSFTFPTVIGQTDYTAALIANIDNLVSLDQMMLLRSGYWNPISRYDPFDLSYLLDTNVSNGQPYAYSYYGQDIRLYPPPDAVYTIKVLGQVRLVPLTLDTQSNSWTTKASRLVKAAAKRMLYSHWILDPDLAQIENGREQDELARLMSESNRRATMGAIVPMQW